MLQMTCGICGTTLIEDCDYDGDEENYIRTELHCPKCWASVSVYFNQNVCVDCDECEHRSEDCICTLSENEDECPLVKAEEV